MKKIVWLVVLVLILIVIYSVAGPAKKAETETGPITIGSILPLTGDAASYGEPGQRIEQMAVDQINAAGGVGGRQLNIIFEDGKCNGKDAANAMQKLANVDKVQVVIGGFCSGESLAAVPIAAAAKVLLFSPGSSNPGLTGINPFFFRNYPSDASQGSVDAATAYTAKNYKKVAIIQEQTDYAKGLNDAFTKTFEALGGTITHEDFISDTTDFRSSLTKLRAANADALFVITQTPATASRIFQQVSELKWKPKMMISEIVLGDPKTVAANKALLEGAIGSEFSVDSANPKFAALAEAYKAKFNEDMPFQAYGQTEYDSVFIVADGIKAVGYNGEKLAAWSRTIKDWPGASGLVTIGADGDPTNGYVAKVVTAGVVGLQK